MTWVIAALLLAVCGAPRLAGLALLAGVLARLVRTRRRSRDLRRGRGGRKGRRVLRPWRLRRPRPPSERRPRWVRGDDLAGLWDDLQRRPRRD